MVWPDLHAPVAIHSNTKGSTCVDIVTMLP